MTKIYRQFPWRFISAACTPFAAHFRAIDAVTLEQQISDDAPTTRGLSDG